MIRRYTAFLIYFSIIAFNLQGQCWQIISSQGNDVSFNDIIFSSDTVGWISNGLGELYKSTNGGINWAAQDAGDLDKAFSVFFLNEQIGWVGHSSRTIFKTTDEGENWEEYNFSTDDITAAQDLEFINIDTGYLVTYYGRVYRSIDGGENWDIVYENDDWLFESLDFVTGQEGWVAGSISLGGPTRIIHTTDAGENWEVQLAAPGTGPDVDLHFLNSETGWFVNEDNLIYKTIDGGDSWQTYPISENINAASPRIFFLNDTLGWATTRGPGRIFVTTDGGESWNTQSTDFPFNIWNTGIYMTGPDHGITVNLNGIIQLYQGGPANCNIELISPATTITALQPEIKWRKVSGCVDGYRLSVGLIPGGTEIIGPLDVGLDTSFLLPFALLEGMDYFVKIVPYNHVHGLATTCGEPFAFTSVICPPTTLVDTSFCDPPFVWVDTSFTEGGTYLFEYFTPLGCDSLVILALSQEEDVFTEIDTALVVGQPYHGVIYESDTLLTEIYTASNGCDSIVQVQITLITGIDDLELISQLQVFPNPVNEQVTFSFYSLEAGKATLEIFDGLGRQVHQATLNLVAGENTYQLSDIENWPTGLYWYRLKMDNRSWSGKVLKE